MLSNAQELFQIYKQARSNMRMGPKVNYVLHEFVRPVNQETQQVEFTTWQLRKLRQALDDALRNAQEETEVSVYRPKVKLIVAIVADEFGISVDDILSHRRTVNVAIPRHIAVYLARRLTLRSTSEIGRLIGKRDHTTILHSINRASEILDSDGFLRERVERLEELLKREPADAET